MLEALTCLKDWEEGHIGLQSWIDDCRHDILSVWISIKTKMLKRLMKMKNKEYEN